MTLTDFIILAVLIIVVGSALAYIIHKKKSGVRCIGCPESGSCSNKKCCCVYSESADESNRK